MRSVFLEAIFRGARFEQHALPVEVLEELIACRELVRAVAKELFFRENPERKRLPKGFSERFDLALSRVDGGSAAAQLTRAVDPGLLPGLTEGDEYARARDLIAAAIAAANEDRPLPVEFPRATISLFNSFGRRLAEDEGVELRGTSGIPGPLYTVATRRTLMGEIDSELEAPFLGYARVAGVEVSPTGACKLALADDRLVRAPLPEPLVETAVSTLSTFPQTWVRVRGTARYDRRDRVLELREVEDLSVVEEEQVSVFEHVLARVMELERLVDGWHDGAGRGLRGRELGWIRAALLLLIGETDLPRPGVYPTIEGRLQVEWAGPSLDVTLTFEPEHDAVAFEVLELDADREQSEVVPRRSLALLVTRLRAVMPRLVGEAV